MGSLSFNAIRRGGGKWIDNYEVLDYIEATGTQYVNIATTLNSNSKIEAEATYTSTSGVQMLYGARNVKTNTALMIGRASNNNTNCYSYYNKEYAAVKTMTASDWTQRHKYTLDKNKTYIDNVLLKTFTASTFDTRTNCYIFAISESGTASYKTSARLHSFKIWQDGTNLTKELYPVRARENSQLGLYDMVNRVFYTNNGSGEFIGGPKWQS